MPLPSKYSLQVLFEIRERAKSDAEEDYAIEQKKVLVEQKKLETLNVDLSRKIEFREKRRLEYAKEATEGRSSIHDIQIQGRHIDSLKAKESVLRVEIENQESILEKQRRVAERKLQEMLKASNEFKTLEKHKEKWKTALNKAIEKREEDIAEEISQSQYFVHIEGNHP